MLGLIRRGSKQLLPTGLNQPDPILVLGYQIKDETPLVPNDDKFNLITFTPRLFNSLR